jgi:hypothetical protein
MRRTPTCFFCFEGATSVGPFTVDEALRRIEKFEAMQDSALDPDSVWVWNLGWRSALPLAAARLRLCTDLGKPRYQESAQ